MAYKINARFTDGSADGWISDIVAAPAPHRGDVISVNRYGRDISLNVTAVWTPSAKLQKNGMAAVIVIEACEIH